jgi:hypothetical protein
VITYVDIRYLVSVELLTLPRGVNMFRLLGIITIIVILLAGNLAGAALVLIWA